MGGLDANLLNKLGVQVVRSTYTSQHQGVVERQIETARLKILKFPSEDPNFARLSMIFH